LFSFVYLSRPFGLSRNWALPKERPLIGVVFNQQKSYIRNLHLYDDAPAQGKFYSFFHPYINPPQFELWVSNILKENIIII